MVTTQDGVARAFMFADLRGYTGFVEAYGDAAAARVLTDYRTLVRAQVRIYVGAEIRTEGDGFYIVFASARDAVYCGLSIVETAESAESGSHPLSIGIGIHFGETVVLPDGYVGQAVNTAARLAGHAMGGEVLVTSTVRDVLRTSGVASFISRGPLRLKGVVEPVIAFRATRLEGGVQRQFQLSRRHVVGAFILLSALLMFALAAVSLWQVFDVAA